MGLLGTYIFVTTMASIASNASTSFAHTLPAAPDFVIINGTNTATTASGTGHMPTYNSDATNVSIFATGVANPPLRVVAVVAHSVIR